MAPQADLIRVIQRLSACRDLAEVMATLRGAARALTGADGVTVVLRDKDLCHYAEEDAIGPLWKGRRFPMSSCISGWCMLHREQVAIPDIYADARIPHDAYRPTFVKSLAMVPIRAHDPIGAIGAYWARQHRASAQELELMQALGDAASVAFANVQLIASLREANRRKDEFLMMLAHELRNPLAPISNALHIQRLRQGDGEEVARARELMERQVAHLARIVDDLLDASRLTHGKVKVRRERLDLAALVRQSAEDRRGLLREAGLTLALELPQLPVWVAGDATRLAQVAGNVLDNARKFTSPGGAVTVSLAEDSRAQRAVLSVRDTGVGIEPQMLPRLFEVFAQEDGSLDRSRGGLGLGLAIARSLLELHGGTIEAASAGTGKGAEFVIRLPLEPEPAALARAPVSVRKAVAAGRVLVVEDNRDAAESLRLLLELHGYSVSVAHTGPEAVAAARDVRPQVVLCDIGLPQMDGFAVARTLRQDRETARARLIAVTGYGSEVDRKKTRAAGFDAHLVKPVDPEILLRQLDAVASG